MDSVEYNILNKKKYFKKRRNFIRRFFLLVFVFLFTFTLFKTYSFSKDKEINVYVGNSFLISSDYVREYVLNEILHKNFFLISGREIGTSLIHSAPILKSVFIRKYIFPEVKLMVFLKEKNIWGKLFGKNFESSTRLFYLTDEADIVSSEYLNLQNIPVEPVHLHIYTKDIPTKETLLLIEKNYLILVDKIKLPVGSLLLTEKNDLEVFSKYGFKIKCGKVDDFLRERILNLNKISNILEGIKKGEYKSGYLDLTLENAAVLKSVPEPKPEKKPGILKFLKRE